MTDSMVDVGKALLSLNLASVIRTLTGGIEKGRQSLRDTYTAVSPFSPLTIGEGMKMIKHIPEVPLPVAPETLQAITLDMRFCDVNGSTPLRDVIAILALAKQQNPSAALEFGTYFGSTTANLALNLPNATIHTIDLPESGTEASALIEGQPIDDEHLIRGRQLGRSFRGTPLETKIVQHQGDTATYDYSVIKDPVTVFLIDGSHTYEYAHSDTMKSFALAKGECTFLWHDCDIFHAGVLKWLVEMIAAGLPVKRIENTALAFMTLDAQDPKIQKFLSA
jgi:hypothetical protein